MCVHAFESVANLTHTLSLPPYSNGSFDSSPTVATAVDDS